MRLRIALTILPFFIGLAGFMSTPQNICMWMLPIEHLYQSVIRLSGIRLEEHQRHLPPPAGTTECFLDDVFCENASEFFLPFLSMAVAHRCARVH